MRLLSAALLFSLVAVIPAAHAADLAVTITGVTADSGDVRVVVIADPDGMARQNMSKNIRAMTADKDGVIVTHFLGVTPGKYGVVAAHDKHVNHAIEKMMTGAVSKPERTSVEARIEVAEPTTAVTLNLQ